MRSKEMVGSHNNIMLTIIFLFFSWIIWNIFFGEHIPAGDGLGWDGTRYAKLAKDFPNLFFHKQIDQYLLQRTLPSSIVYFCARFNGIQLTNAQIPLAFSIYNASLLLIALFIWDAIVKKLAWRPQVRLISFAGLFLNYAILKMNTYYPTLTDTSAFVCGLLMIYFFLCKKNYYVLLTGLFGAFIFPTLLYIGILLYIFPKQNNPDSTPRLNMTSKKVIVLAMVKALIIVALSIGIYWVTHNEALGGFYALPVLLISAITLFVYLFYALFPISHYSFHYFSRLKHAISYRVIVALLVIFCLHAFIGVVSNDDVVLLTPHLFIINITKQALAYPLNFLISHVIYYGPIVCLIMYFWQDVVKYIQGLGFGLFFVTALYVVLFIGSESRQLINFFPIGVIAIAETLNRKVVSWKFSYLFVLLSLLVSKAWLPLNHGNWPSLLTNPPELTLEFPLQWYFMSQGPWVSHKMYIFNIMLVSSVFIVIWKLTKSQILQIMEN